jgi:hypothetical protein
METLQSLKVDSIPVPIFRGHPNGHKLRFTQGGRSPYGGLIATGLLNDAFTYDSPAIKVILGVGFIGLGVLGTVGTGDVMFGKDVDALLIG